MMFFLLFHIEFCGITYQNKCEVKSSAGIYLSDVLPYLTATLKKIAWGKSFTK